MGATESNYGRDRMPQRRGWLPLAFGALLILAIAGAVALWLNRGSAGTRSEATTTVTVDAPNPSPEGTAASRVNESASPAPAPDAMTAEEAAAAQCFPPTGSSALPTSPPAGTVWETQDRMLVPRGEAGPTLRGGSVRRCYAHTPTGAMFAAYNIPMMAIIGSDRELVLQNQVTPGPLKTVMERMTIRPDQPVSQRGGIRILDYSPERMTYELLEEHGDQAWIVTGRLTWKDDDWKIDGSFRPPARRDPSGIPGESGWIVWKAVGE